MFLDIFKRKNNTQIKRLDSQTETRASLENPSTSLSDPDAWIFDAFGSAKSDSGISVTPSVAMTYAPVFRAIALISGDVAKLPLDIYVRDGKCKSKANKHAAYRLLKHKSNNYMTAHTFKQTLTAQAVSRGNGYAYIQRDGQSKPYALIPLNTDDVNPIKINGSLFYRYKEQDLIPAYNILHIKGLPDGSGICGLDPISYARQSIGLGLATQKYGSKYFSNGARPPVVIEFPQNLEPKQAKQILTIWNSAHKGLKNSHKAAILHSGAKINTIDINNENAQFLQTRQFSIREVATWFGLPPHKLGDTTRTAYASLEQENQSYLNESLDHWLCSWESECWDKLLTANEQFADSHIIEFNRSALVRADMTARFTAYNTGIMGGWLTRDEVRARENLNPLPNGEGENPFTPLNMSTDGTKPESKPQDGTKPESKPQNSRHQTLQTHRALMTDVLTRMLTRIAKSRTKLASLETENRGIILIALNPVVAAVNTVSTTKLDADSIATELFNEIRNADTALVKEYVEGMVNTFPKFIAERIS